MSIFAPPRSFDPDKRELIDRPGLDPALLCGELKALEDINRRCRGHQLLLDFMEGFLDSGQRNELRVLDLATGAADLPRCVAAWFRDRQLPVRITAVDSNPEVVSYARESCRDWPEICLEQHDLRDLPYAPKSYDLVLCSLALHHFSSPEALKILRQMQEIARVGYIVSDLRRNWPAIWMVELLAHTVIKDPLVRHDAPQSCRAAFTVEELQSMAREAGLKNYQIERRRGVFHMVLVGRN